MTDLHIVLDRSRCSSIGICESIAPDYFEVGDDAQLILHREAVTPGDEADVRDAVRSCPAAALRIVEDSAT